MIANGGMPRKTTGGRAALPGTSAFDAVDGSSTGT